MAFRFSPPPVVITLAIAFAMFGICWPMLLIDLVRYNIPWVDHIIEAGPLGAFAQPFANYNPPYLYLLALISPLHVVFSQMTLVKLASLIGTVALSAASYDLLKQLKVDQAERWAALIMVLPTTFINAAILGQCDALYVAPAIMAVSAALGRRHAMMLVWCGVAFAFKLQAILFAPFVVALLINRQIPLRYWFIPPAIFLGSLLPAWALGWPARDLLNIYVGQANTFPELSRGAPNVWAFVEAVSSGFAQSLSDTVMLFAVGVTAAYVFFFSRQMPDGKSLLLVAVMAVLMTAGLLPHMHERYFLFADIGAFLYAISTRTRIAGWIALLVQCGSFFAIASYLVSSSWMVLVGSAAMMAATGLVARILLCSFVAQPTLMTSPAVR